MLLSKNRANEINNCVEMGSSALKLRKISSKLGITQIIMAKIIRNADPNVIQG